jgi:molybdenum cofactor cytidylyltransferase
MTLRPRQTPGMPTAVAVAVVLAAGAGSRFHAAGHKLDAELGGRTVLRRALDAAVASGVGPVLVVVGDDPDHAVHTAIPDGVATVVNRRWRDGSATSLQAALAAAHHLGAGRALIALGDQPFITPDAWRDVAAADAAVAVATYDGVRGHPVQLRADIWPLLPTEGDEGAKAVMRLRPDLVREIPCRGSALDIDTVEDLHRWQNSSSTSSP